MLYDVDMCRVMCAGMAVLDEEERRLYVVPHPPFVLLCGWPCCHVVLLLVVVGDCLMMLDSLCLFQRTVFKELRTQPSVQCALLPSCFIRANVDSHRPRVCLSTQMLVTTGTAIHVFSQRQRKTTCGRYALAPTMRCLPSRHSRILCAGGLPYSLCTAPLRHFGCTGRGCSTFSCSTPILRAVA